MSPAIVVVGSYVQDLTWRCAQFPARGETVLGRFAAGPGGKGSNQAVAAARAGASVCFVGAVGRDVLAQAARSFYRREKIGRRLVEKPGHATGTAAILVNAAGENEIIVALGANAALARGDIDRQLVERARVVVTQHETSLATTGYVLRLARRAGATTIHNPAPMRDDFDPGLLKAVDVLIPNEHEFLSLLGRRGRARITEPALRRLRDAALHAQCRSLGVPTVIVTLGARGCFVSQADTFTRIAGHAGLRVVDTTGAGDAFVGGFAAGLVRFKGDTVRAAEFANAVAALSVTHAGTAPAMPRAVEIEQFLRRRRTGR
jgi:ribokinase